MSTQSNLRAAGREICTRQVETNIRLLHEVFDGRGISVHTNTTLLSFLGKGLFSRNIDGTRSRGDEWSLRAFASMPCTAIFLRARAEIKNFALRAASSLDRLNFASKSSKGKILRTVKNFHGPFITPRSKYIRTQSSQKFIYNITYANLIWLTHFMVKQPVKMFK